jgi:hypothetical protein
MKKIGETVFHELPNGDLLTDAGKPAPGFEPSGYMQDLHDRHRFHPVDPSEIRPCSNCRGL